MPFLDDCARSTPGTNTQIDYPTLVAATRGDLQLLQASMIRNIDALRRRQAALRALDDEGRAADVLAYANNEPAFLASTGLPIRSSHAGTPIDNGLPQGPYTAAPGAATAGIRGRANYAWLRESTTGHTTNPDPASGLAADANRVASYFEFHIPTIRAKGTGGPPKLEGGRVVYDPFAHRFFVSAHYLVEFELINVPALTAHPIHQQTRNRIQAYGQAQVGGLPGWWDLYTDMVVEMGNGNL